jgi:glycosyltransferase involved in cell wall biosynthesis
MRIVMLSREHPATGYYGGIGTYTQQMSQGMAALGHDVSVITQSPNSSQPFEENGVRIYPVAERGHSPLPFGNRYLGSSVKAWNFARSAGQKLNQLHLENPVDILEIPEYQGWGLSAAILAKRYQIPVLSRLHAHSQLVRRLNNGQKNLDLNILTYSEKLSLNLADRILANSNALKETLKKDLNIAKDIGVLGLGVDTQKFKPGTSTLLRDRLGLSEESLIVLYIGRLETRKGILDLVEAWKNISQERADVHLVLAGADTPYQPQQMMSAHIEALNLPRVHLLGPIPYHAVPDYYQGADLVVAPSPYEPFGLIYLESMACGVATIGCAAAGALEIIQDGLDGALVSPNNPQQLEDKILELLNKPDLRHYLASNARKSVYRRFRLELVALKTIEAYHLTKDPKQLWPRHFQTA